MYTVYCILYMFFYLLILWLLIEVGEDFEADEGSVVFSPGECEKKIEMTVKGKKRPRHLSSVSST